MGGGRESGVKRQPKPAQAGELLHCQVFDPRILDEDIDPNILDEDDDDGFLQRLMQSLGGGGQ